MGVAVVARAVVFVAGLVAVVVVVGMVPGCPSRSGDAHDLAVWSDAEARRVVDEALQDLRAGHVEAVVARFCDQSDDGVGRARALLTPGLGKDSLAIRRVEPAWVGKEPFFYVEVGDGAGWVHGFGVQVRQGCLERAVGAADPAIIPAVPAPAVPAVPALPALPVLPALPAPSVTP